MLDVVKKEVEGGDRVPASAEQIQMSPRIAKSLPCLGDIFPRCRLSRQADQIDGPWRSGVHSFLVHQVREKDAEVHPFL